ncbi:MAG: phosphoribosylglycinamide formyltransferase [Gemmatales bacterium]|nr:phosphoribosylglycinamide formyltransferase [Gemmatales bacterium]MCS7160627.1 phosphoribosylglycinamide formyltransferase [Gemmatales bacterium]MDW8175828.1 phosphoribosylglycinamide formyltransferase [Gemmatales bacterium]MDW8221952.1 phosphoribosylglycinamide formyltransferase [Gemmatales bacterium]
MPTKPPKSTVNVKKPLRLAVLISGTGNTLQNLIEHIRARKLPAEIVLVISSKADVAGVEKARRAGLPTEIILRSSAETVEAFSQAIFECCREVQADLVCMAGFLHLLRIPDDFQNRVMNIHPALLPAFGGKGYYGLRVHQAVLEYGCKVTGCTVHFADNEYDHGPIIVQRVVPVLDDDTPESLAARVFEEECEAYPEAIRLFAEGRLRVEGRRVRILTRC